MTNRLASGFGWSFLEACFRLGLQFALSVVLARLLTPAEFGLIGIVSIFNVIAMTCVDAGFGNALIQRKEVTETEKSSVFYLNVVVGLLTATVLALSAPLIAWFFHQPV